MRRRSYVWTVRGWGVVSNRLTLGEIKALMAVALEFDAGHDPEMTVACGLADDEKKAATLLSNLSSAIGKLAGQEISRQRRRT
jgi:hypothetical protein